MKRILVIGSPGAGKSSFSRSLRDLTGLSLYHLDMIWHKRDLTHISKEEFDKRLLEIVEKDSWIIDGTYKRTLEMRLMSCDTVFFLDYSPEVCIKGVEERVGKWRDDLPWLEDFFEEEFRQYIVDFPRDQTPIVNELLEKYKSQCRIIRFRSRSESDEFLANLQRTSQ